MRISALLGMLICMMLLGQSFQVTAQKKPNVLIIMTDELSAESMSIQLGNKFINTPNIDYLASHGARFTNAYCANPLCVPSRSSIFTGRYPHEMGIQNNDEKLVDPKVFPSAGTIFKNAGYETGYIGKWHLPYDRNNDLSHGFDYMSNRKGNGTDSLLPGYAAKFLETKRDNPFFLVVSFLNPHNICQWARGDKLPDGAIGDAPPADQCPPLRPNAMPSKNETDIMQFMRTSMQNSDAFPVGNFTDEKWRQYIWSYYRLIEKVDAEIGKILTTLKKNGLDKNTLIVFTADHGDCQGAHRWNQKTVFYEEAAKVPFILSYPSIKPGVYKNLVQTGIDILPSICEFAGIQSPNLSGGISVKKRITQNDIAEDRSYVVVSDHLVQGAGVNGVDPKPEGRMLRNKQFKYWIYNEGKQRETLYDIQHDPYEMNNLADDPKYKNALNTCRAQLLEWAKEHNDSYLKFLVQK